MLAFFSNWLRGDAYKEQRTGVEFPEAIDGYKRGKVAPYEAEPGKKGVTIEYGARDAEVTIYIRVLGDEAHKTSADFLKDSIAGVKELETQGKYTNVKFYQFGADKERPGWKTAAFTSNSTNHFLTSFIFCKVIPEHLVKIRATTGNPKIESLLSFTKRLQEIMDKEPRKP